MTHVAPQLPGQALRILREEAGLTAKQVAVRAGVSESYLSRVENGKEDPSATWLGSVSSAISEALVDSALSKRRVAS